MFVSDQRLLRAKYVPMLTTPQIPKTTNGPIIVFSSFVLLFVLFVFVCFPCCDYIIACNCALFNEQIKGIMFFKPQKCDTVLHKQQNRRKWFYRVGVNVLKLDEPGDTFLNLLYNYNK